MKGKISENELEEMQKSVLNLSDIIVSIKKDILDTLINFIDKKSINSNNDKLKLIKNLYLILTSSIETLDAKYVEV